ncbi:FKBP-type peptidyl-prolyl cis-trans isomerase [Lysobacter sp. A3-1-A15]|uniref:FKBP-type peptidyl-prolyl cis-trans isomerase n=1 Tax=Novilysobacter viscosus TaxID=3098602 RepID=UPI002EDB2B5C
MKAFVRGAAVLLTTAAAALLGTAAIAQEKTVLTTDREKASYMVGYDVGRSIGPAGPDLDVAAFGRALDRAFEGGEPLLSEQDAQATSQALMQRVESRAGRLPADAKVPDVDTAHVGYLIGGNVGRSLAPIKDELDMPVVLQAVRAVLADTPLLMEEAELNAVRESFSTRLQAGMAQKAQAASEANRAEGEAFLARNKQVKGVITTGSGLQYMVLRQGSGAMPRPTDRVRVHYHGTLLDGTVFDSSYDRGQPAEFGLSQVIPGWTEGVGLMPVGAKYRFWIPGELAYGPRGTPGGPIGPDATLVFDVELQAIL